MMRIRIDGGAMTAEQLRAIAWASERYGRDVADVTDRQNVQLHWIRIEDVPAIWERIEAVGLSTQEACGDTPRVILGCPLAGVDGRRGPRRDARHPGGRRTRFLGDPAFSNLPRKYKTSISGCAAGCTNHEINDVSFVGVAGPGGEPGYDLQVGGGLSTNPMFAQRLGAFVPRERVPEVWAGVTGAVPRVRLPAIAQPRALEVPGEGLGTGAGARGAGAGVPRRLACRTARRPALADGGARPRRRACRSATDGCPWGSRRGPDASPATSCASSPTWPTRSATGSGAHDHAAEARDPRRGAAIEPTSWSRGSTSSTCARARARSARGRWPAPASSSASSRSARRRAARLAHRGARGAAARLRRGRSASTSTAARTPARGSRSPTSG